MPRRRPPEPAHSVVSVPHSGTRSLVEHLQFERHGYGRWMHFGYDGHKVPIDSGRYHMHIPVRHPHDVATSHARRGKNLDRLIAAYRHMFESLQRPHTLYNMHELPVLAGFEDRDRDSHKGIYVRQYIDAVDKLIVGPHEAWFRNVLGESYGRDTDAERSAAG